MDNKIFKIIFMILLGVSALLSILFMVDVITESLLINYCYLLLGVAAATAIIFSILNMVKDPKKAKSALIGIVVLGVIVGISYAIAGADEFFNLDGEMIADAATSKKSGAGLVTFYILGILAIGSIIFAEVSKIFK